MVMKTFESSSAKLIRVDWNELVFYHSQKIYTQKSIVVYLISKIMAK